MKNNKSNPKGASVPRNRKNKNSKNKNTRSQNNGINSNRSASSSVPFLSPCSKKYMAVLCAPFSELDNVCIPDTMTLPSQKLKVTCRGFFNSGAQGCGAVMYNPWLMLANDGITNAIGCSSPVLYSNAAWNQTLLPTAYESGDPRFVGLSAANSNSMYSWAVDFVPPSVATFRLVGAGLRIRYTGTELNRSGRVIMYRDRGNAAVTNVGGSQMLRDNFYHTLPMTRKWSSITYQPSRQDDVSYGLFENPTYAVNIEDYRCMVAYVDGTVASSSYEFEAIAYFELIYNRVAQTTQSHSDPIGFGAIMTALPSTFIGAAPDLFKAVARGAAEALHHSTSGIGTAVIKTLAPKNVSDYLYGMGEPSYPTITDVD